MPAVVALVALLLEPDEVGDELAQREGGGDFAGNCTTDASGAARAAFLEI
ncbi:MAG TPA: hypothetical protein VH083_11330 [Myxococcales bacterium]|nr:hypothetical protein [Myxococcales bacterium]